MSTRRASLRWTMAWAFTLLGALLSVLFAGATLYITEDYEHILVDEILRGQADDYSLRLRTHPDAPLPRTRRLSGYVQRPMGATDVPTELQGLPPGIHEHETEVEDGIHIGVFDTHVGRLFFVIDLTDIERLERHLAKFLIGVVLLSTGVSAWLGWLLAGATLAPVRRLASAVDALPAQPQRTQLAAEAAPDELGRLAHAFDRYQARLVEADESERAFYADASHELRTPVAVVRGAVELLVEEPGATEGMRRRLQRLDRGVSELTELLDVLLGQVRQRELVPVTVAATDLLAAAVAPFQEAHAQRIWFDIDAIGTMHVPEREAVLILRGIIRRMLPAAASGRLALRFAQGQLQLDFSDEPDKVLPSEPLAGPRSDRGLGLTLIGRLAARLGWRIEEVLDTAGRRRVRLHLPA